MATDDGFIIFVILAAVVILISAGYGWTAAMPSTLTTEQACSTEYNVSHTCTATESGCKTGSIVFMNESTTCTGAHVSAPIKAHTWFIGGMIALCVLLFIIAEVIIINKARKGEWANTEWEFIGVNALAILIIVTIVGAFNLLQAWFMNWIALVDWTATLIWFMKAILYVLECASALLILYISKRALWNAFVVPAREVEMLPPQPIQYPKRGRPLGSRNKRRRGRPRKVK
jgi:hypothetical protein